MYTPLITLQFADTVCAGCAVGLPASSGAVRRPHQLRGGGGAGEARACFGGGLPGPFFAREESSPAWAETLQSPRRRRGSGELAEAAAKADPRA